MKNRPRLRHPGSAAKRRTIGHAAPDDPRHGAQVGRLLRVDWRDGHGTGTDTLSGGIVDVVEVVAHLSIAVDQVSPSTSRPMNFALASSAPAAALQHVVQRFDILLELAHHHEGAVIPQPAGQRRIAERVLVTEQQVARHDLVRVVRGSCRARQSSFRLADAVDEAEMAARNAFGLPVSRKRRMDCTERILYALS